MFLLKECHTVLRCCIRSVDPGLQLYKIIQNSVFPFSIFFLCVKKPNSFLTIFGCIYLAVSSKKAD